MTRPETKIENAFVRWCKTHLKLKARKLADLGEKGFPDRSIIVNKRLICIEFKSPNGDLDVLQIRRIDELENEGVPVLVTCDLKQAKLWTAEQVKRAYVAHRPLDT